jgi:hypothetical protein
MLLTALICFSCSKELFYRTVVQGSIVRLRVAAPTPCYPRSHLSDPWLPSSRAIAASARASTTST